MRRDLDQVLDREEVCVDAGELVRQVPRVGTAMRQPRVVSAVDRACAVCRVPRGATPGALPLAVLVCRHDVVAAPAAVFVAVSAVRAVPLHLARNVQHTLGIDDAGWQRRIEAFTTLYCGGYGGLRGLEMSDGPGD